MFIFQRNKSFNSAYGAFPLVDFDALNNFMFTLSRIVLLIFPSSFFSGLMRHTFECFEKFSWWSLKVQSCKSYSNKCMITLTQIRNTEVFAFIAVLVFKLLSCKVLFINRKDNRNRLKVGYFLRK